MKIRYATSTCVVAHAGLRITLQAGEAWDADDPLVAANPDMFSARPLTVRGTAATGLVDRPVEQATAAPGEKRATVRGV